MATVNARTTAQRLCQAAIVTLVLFGVLVTEGAIRSAAADPVVTISAPADASAAVVGESVALVGNTTDTLDGDLGAALSWESDLQGFLGTGPSLLALGLQAGTHTITAHVTNSSGLTGQASVMLRVVPAALRIPAAADAYVGADLPTQNFGAASTLAADASPDRQAFLRFVVSGTTGLVIERATLQLTVSGKSGSDSDSGGSLYAISDTGWEEAALTYATRPPIDRPPLAGRGPVAKGELVEFDVTGVVAGDGAVVFALTSASGNVVQYKSRETASGQPTLVLTLRSASVPDAAPTLAITGPPDGTLVAPGTAVSLTAVASDREDGDLTAAVAWSSNLVGHLGTGSPLALSLPAGTHRIRAEVTDHLGQAAAAEMSLLVNTAPAVTIASPADGAVVAEGTPLVLDASAVDAEQGDLSASLTWTSNQDGVLGHGATLAIDTLTPGAHTITATVTDGFGTPGSASVGVVVRTGTLSLRPVADTYVAADRPTENFGTSRTLTADASPERLLFLRFEVSGLGNLSPDRARLRLTVSDASGSASSDGGTLRGVTDTGWDERTLTYTDRPPVDGPEFGAAGPVDSGQVVDFDVTGAIRGDGTYTFAVVTSSSNRVGYLSREAAFGAPQLLLITSGLPSEAPTVSITAPADSSTVALGAPIILNGSATDPEEGDLSGVIGWSSNRDGALGVGASLAVSDLSAGAHVITAKVTDASGGTATASVSITVTGGMLTLTPSADATVNAGAPDSNYGSSSALGGDKSPARRSYLRFEVPDLGAFTIKRATLRLTVRTRLGSGSDAGGDVHRLGTASWTESAITFNTSPPVTGPILASAGPVAEGEVVEFDLTGAVTGHQANDFVIDTGSSNKVEYSSREDGGNEPRLILVVE